MTDDRKVLLEVIACSVAEAITPSLELVTQIKRAVAMPLRVMLRENEDYETILKIGRETGICEFHVGRAARVNFQIEGDVQSSLVSTLSKILREI